MLPGFCRDTVSRLRAPFITERGVSVRDWTHAVSKDIGGCSIQPASTSGDYDAREQATDRMTLYAPEGSDIVKGDRIVFNGDTYLIDGAPYTWNSPTGAVSHMVVPLERWEG